MNEQTSTLGVPQIKRLNGLPRGRMTADERLEALRRVQEQAEQRTQLGAKLLTAARQTFAEQQDMVNALREEQKQLREQMQADMARSFQQYDQYLGDISGGVAQRMEELVARVSRIESDWSRAQERIERFMHRAESLMEESRNLLAKTREVREAQPRESATQAVDPADAQPVQPSAPQAASHGRVGPAAMPDTQGAPDRHVNPAPQHGRVGRGTSPSAALAAADQPVPMADETPPAASAESDASPGDAPPREASLIYTEIIDRLRARCREQQRRAATQAR